MLGVGALLLFLFVAWSVQKIPTSWTPSAREFSQVCEVRYRDKRRDDHGNPGAASDQSDLPTIFFITPTYPRREQMAELMRLGQTLLHVPALHWIVADDSRSGCNPAVSSLLHRLGIPYTYISSPMPSVYHKGKSSYFPRGVANRRAALQWLRLNAPISAPGVLYFGDDDNAFDLRLFHEIRHTKRVSMFPVGLIGEYGVSAPVIKDGKVVGFFDSWPAKRKFAVDMAGFAVGMAYFLEHPNASMPYKTGYEEDSFLQSLGLKVEDIEVKADGCTKILVWHTQTVKKKVPMLKISRYDDTSLKPLMEELESLGLAHRNSKGIKTFLTTDGKEHAL